MGQKKSVAYRMLKKYERKDTEREIIKRDEKKKKADSFCAIYEST